MHEFLVLCVRNLNFGCWHSGISSLPLGMNCYIFLKLANPLWDVDLCYYRVFFKRRRIDRSFLFVDLLFFGAAASPGATLIFVIFGCNLLVSNFVVFSCIAFWAWLFHSLLLSMWMMLKPLEFFVNDLVKSIWNIGRYRDCCNELFGASLDPHSMLPLLPSRLSPYLFLTTLMVGAPLSYTFGDEMESLLRSVLAYGLWPWWWCYFISWIIL